MQSMTSRISLLSFLLVTSTFIAQSIAIPAAASPSVTPPPNPAAIAASAAAASAAAAYSDAQQLSAAALSDASFYATAAGSAGAAGTGVANPSGPDACGPKVPDPRVTDSCDSPVDTVQAPAPYGVQCLNDGTTQQLNESSCAELIPIMCTNEFQHAGEWVWASQKGCSIGSFLPPESLVGAAQWPPQINCEELIYGAMLDACTGSGGNQYNVAAVNLNKLPNNQPGGTGAAVNVGYPSYLIAAKQPRNIGDVAGSSSAVAINAGSILTAEASAFSFAYSSESALLATMTGSAASQARTDLAAYQSLAPSYYGPP